MSLPHVHDFQLMAGNHQVSIIEKDGLVTYIVIDETHLTFDEFEEMVIRVEDFLMEEHDAAQKETDDQEDG